MDILINCSDGDITVSNDDSEVGVFSQEADPVVMLEETLAALGFTVDVIRRDTEEEDEAEEP